MSVACHTPGTAIHTLSVHSAMSPLLATTRPRVFEGRLYRPPSFFSAEETTCWVLLEPEQLIPCSGLKIFLWECLEISGGDWEL